MLKATLETIGQTYKSEGKTMEEVLSNFDLNYTNIKAKGVITVTQGKKKIEKLFYLKPLRMLFASRLRRVGFAKQMQSLLEAKVAPVKGD